MDDFSAGEFIQGFLEEAGEHLQQIQQNLLRLDELLTQTEEAGGDAADAANAADAASAATAADAEAEQTQRINELFRSFHTIKGLAGMIRLDEASSLSHALETVLQAARTGQVKVSPALCDQLLEGTRVLRVVIDTLVHPDQEMPDTQAVIEDLHQFLKEEPNERAPQTAPALVGVVAPVEEPATGSPVEQGILTILPDLKAYPDILKLLTSVELQKIRRAAQEGLMFSLALFAPSVEKSARGENVDYVRNLLSQVGSLVKAVPLMQNGSVRFAFLVASSQPVEASTMALDEVVPLASQVSPPPQARSTGSASVYTTRAGSRSTVVRVELERLDELVRYAGDLLILRSRLGESLPQLNGAPVNVRRDVTQTYEQLGRTLRDLRRAILRARMVPLGEVFNHMPLVVRDVARSTGKDVRLKMEGETAEVDKMLVERLLDPLVHLLRNAVIHGIEPSEARVAAGKPAQGNLMLRGLPVGDHILITVSDDGRGIDLGRVQQKAQALGWLEEGYSLNPAEALDLITRSGFTTQDRADLSSGRGMGLDIVLKMVRSVGGSLDVETTVGQGTAFQIRLPLTLMIMDAMIVQVGDERYAIPRDMVDEVLEVNPQDVVVVESGQLLEYRGGPVVLHDLTQRLEAPQAARPAPPQRCRFGLLRRSGGRHLDALVVDRVIGLREVVVHTLNDPLIARPGIGGATELGDGRVVLILDLPVLLRSGR